MKDIGALRPPVRAILASRFAYLLDKLLVDLSAPAGGDREGLRVSVEVSRVNDD